MTSETDEAGLFTVEGLRVAVFDQATAARDREEGGRGDGWVEVVSDASFSVRRGEVLAVVGESASGKSLMVMGAINLLAGGARVVAGRTTFDGHLIQDTGSEEFHRNKRRLFPELDRPEWRDMVGKGIGVLFQDPIASFDPLETVGLQSGEVLEVHTELTQEEIEQRVLDALGEVKLPKRRKFLSFPHTMSRGEAQRAMLAAALLSSPQLLLADEPLTGLDVTVASAILALIEDMRRSRGMAMVLVTHDLATVAGIADRVAVVYGGRIVEEGPVAQIFYEPKHPYTSGLLGATPWAAGRRLRAIEGDPPVLTDLPAGCSFEPRCEHAVALCSDEEPEERRIGESRVRCWRADQLTLEGVGRSGGS